MTRYTLFTIFLIAVVTSSLPAGTTGKIRGVVFDMDSGLPLAGVNIILEGTQKGAASDDQGKFFIINIPPGMYRLSVRMIGYRETIVEEVRVKIDQTTNVEVSLIQEVIEGETVVIVAERPKVEKDLTASKETLSDDDIMRSWGTDIEEVIRELPGLNVNGGIRGGFGLHESYRIDGMDMRDIGSNTNFKTVNLSSIKEMEVLTGGYNAEYGQANGAIMNIVTRNAMDRIHGIVNHKVRPAGRYHWGSNIYGPDTFQRTVMTTTDFWNPNSSWQTEWMDESHSGYSGEYEPFISMTPTERAAWWTNFVNDDDFHNQMHYTEYAEWETELTLYGPLSSKMGFMLSARYKQGVPRYPSAFLTNPDMTFQGSLTYRLSNRTRIELAGVYTQFKNSGASRTNFASTEDTFHDNSSFPFVTDPYGRYVYWMYGATSSSEWQVRAPEYAKFFNTQIKLTHTFSQKTYLEVALQHSNMDYRMDYREVLKTAYYDDLGYPDLPEAYPIETLPYTIRDYKWAMPGDMWMNHVQTANSTVKADLISQITEHHQLQIGALFSSQKFDKVLHDHQNLAGSDYEGYLTDLGPTVSYPYEGAFYVQDKVEFEGVVINAGVRVDFFDANKSISVDAYDPLMISVDTEGNVGRMGIVSYDTDGIGPGYVKTPTQWAVSPRFGISHPIDENTVLHFMYGDFYQRPPWQKIVSPVVVRTRLPTPEEGGTSTMDLNPDSALVCYNHYTHVNSNPALTWEKMTQYEVGIERNIADLFYFDMTMYSRDAHNLTSQGLRRGPSELLFTKSGTSRGSVTIRMFGNSSFPLDDRRPGKTVGLFETFVNGAWARVRGAEMTFGSKFRNVNFEFNYTLSFLTTGLYHMDYISKYFPEQNLYSGANNLDNGINGVDDDSWNPHNSAYLKVSVILPRNLGPRFFGSYPFGNWSIHASTRWAQGQRFTYYPPDYTSEEVPNNRRWKDRWETNMSVIKKIKLLQGMDARLSIQIKNLFNNKHLRLPTGGDNRIRYFQEGLMPVHDITREPLVWSWYTNRPREIYVGVGVEF